MKLNVGGGEPDVEEREADVSIPEIA